MKKFILLFSLLILVMQSGAQLEVHQGFPVNTGYELRVNVVAADIDGDGIFEVIAAPENRIVKVYNDTGVLKWENVSGTSRYDYARTPLVRNFTGDGRLEVLTYGNPSNSDPTFYIWDAEGIRLVEMLFEKYLLISTPSVTQDGIILAGAAPGTSFGPILNYSGLHAYDTTGNRLWYLELGNKSSFFASMPLADIDDDGDEEVILLTHDTDVAYPTDGRIWVIDVNRTQGTVKWSRPLGGDARNVAVGDLNRDGRLEIVAVSSGGVYIFNGEGDELHRFSINSNNAVPAIGDVDKDGINDVVIASNSENKIYIISNGSLREFPSIKSIWTNVVLSDLNRDGNIEIAGGDTDGNMYVWDRNGYVLEQRKIIGTGYIPSSALIADLDRDGNKELIFGVSNGNDGYISAYTYWNLSAETAPPTTTNDVDGAWHNSSVTVTLTAADANSGVSATYYTTDGTLPTMSSPIGNVINLTKERVYTIRYFSVDNVGNVEDVRTAVNQVKIDKVKPSSWDDADNLWHNASTALNITVTDSFSGVAFLFYKADGVKNSSSGNTNLVFTEDGVHTIEYYGVDNAGNYESPKNAIVKIDMTSPFTSDDGDGLWHNDSVTVRLSANDYLSGVNATYNKVTSVPLSVLDSFFSWLGGILGMAEGYVEGDNVTLSNEGIYVVTYYSNDRVGNTEAEKVTGQVRIDKTLPTTTVTVPINKTYLPSESITLDFSAQDGLSGIKIISGSIDGIRPVSSGEVLNMGTLGGGGHEFILTVEDNASNINTQTVFFNVAGEALQAMGYVNGTVIDNSTAAGISGAKVIVTQTGMNTSTDEFGFYSLYLDAGIFNLTVNSEPEYYQNNSVSVTVNSGETVNQDINLTKKPVGTITGKVANI